MRGKTFVAYSLLLAGACLCLAMACSKATVSRAGPGKESPAIIRVCLVGPEPADMASVTAEMNKLAFKDLGATIKWTFLGWDKWEQKYNMALASGEPVSLIYTSDWANYQSYARKGAFLPLDSLLAETSPGIWKSMTNHQWNEARVGASIYTVPCDWKEYVTNSLTYRADLAASLGFSEPLADFDDIEAFLSAAKARDPSSRPFEGTVNDFEGIQDAFLGKNEKVIRGTLLSYLAVVDPAGRLFSWFESPGFLRYATMMHRWYEKGFWSDDVVSERTLSEDYFREGRNAVCFQNPAKADALFRSISETRPEWKLGAFVFALARGVVHPNASVGNGMALPVGCPDPALALRFLELLQSDPRYYRLTTYGIEGRHYRVDKDGFATTLPDSGFSYEAMQPWGWHVDDMSLPSRDLWPEYGRIERALEAVATPNRYASFAFSVAPVGAQVAAMMQAAERYLYPVMTGKVSDPAAAIARGVAELKAAGLDRYMQELRRQLDAFLEEQAAAEKIHAP